LEKGEKGYYWGVVVEEEEEEEGEPEEGDEDLEAVALFLMLRRSSWLLASSVRLTGGAGASVSSLSADGDVAIFHSLKIAGVGVGTSSRSSLPVPTNPSTLSSLNASGCSSTQCQRVSCRWSCRVVGRVVCVRWTYDGLDVVAGLGLLVDPVAEGVLKGRHGEVGQSDGHQPVAVLLRLRNRVRHLRHELVLPGERSPPHVAIVNTK
jgi:hypothetical protein